MTGARDRSGEFLAIVDRLRATTPGGASRLPTKVTYDKSQFALVASAIGKDITATTEKLERLSKLAKKKSLFDDPAVEIQELTAVINQDIKNINQQISFLQAQKDMLARKNQHSASHSDTIVDTLKSKLKNTTKSFSTVLQLRTENLKTQQKERETFTGSLLGNDGAAATSPLHARKSASTLYKPANSGDVSIFLGGEDQQQQQQQAAPHQQQLTLHMGASDRYIVSRAQAVQSIERTMVELQSIFSNLASIVNEHGQLIQRIDADIDVSARNVDSAQSEFLKYLSGISNNRWLIMKVFAILFVFIVLFIVFFV